MKGFTENEGTEAVHEGFRVEVWLPLRNLPQDFPASYAEQLREALPGATVLIHEEPIVERTSARVKVRRERRGCGNGDDDLLKYLGKQIACRVFRDCLKVITSRQASSLQSV